MAKARSEIDLFLAGKNHELPASGKFDDRTRRYLLAPYILETVKQAPNSDERQIAHLLGFKMGKDDYQPLPKGETADETGFATVLGVLGDLTYSRKYEAGKTPLLREHIRFSDPGNPERPKGEIVVYRVNPRGASLDSMGRQIRS